MQNHVLIVSDQEHVRQRLDFLKKDWNYQFSRACLKTKQILTTQKISLILWDYSQTPKLLIQDLIGVFNRFITIPILVLYENSLDSEYLTKINNHFETIEFYEDKQDILAKIEELSNGFTYNTPSKKPSLHEIEFRNVLQKTISKTDTISSKSIQSKLPEKSLHVKLSAPWNSVDKTEKEFLINSDITSKKNRKIFSF